MEIFSFVTIFNPKEVILMNSSIKKLFFALSLLCIATQSNSQLEINYDSVHELSPQNRLDYEEKVIQSLIGTNEALKKINNTVDKCKDRGINETDAWDILYETRQQKNWILVYLYGLLIKEPAEIKYEPDTSPEDTVQVAKKWLEEAKRDLQKLCEKLASKSTFVPAYFDLVIECKT